MDKPRILFGMNSMFAAQNLLPDILSVVERRGFEAVVVAPDSPTNAPPLVLGDTVQLRHIAMRREIALLSDIRALWQMWSILRSIQPCITDMSTPKMAFIGGLAAWLARVPHRIYTLRGLRYETTRLWKRFLLIACERIACACAHQVICISHSVQEVVLKDRIAPRIKATMLGDRGSEGIVIPPDDEPRNESSRELRKSVGIPGDVPVIGFVGRLTRDKGVEELVQSFRALRSEGRDVHLLLLGTFETGDPVDPDTAAWIRNDPHIHWAGFLSNPAPYYGLMDVFVFPTYREGLPKVLLEAAAAGRPIVSTYTTGVVDIIQNGVTGMLVPPRNAGALCSAVGLLLSDAALADRLGRAAKALVRQHFDQSIYLERLGAMLESLATQRRPPVRQTQDVVAQTE